MRLTHLTTYTAAACAVVAPLVIWAPASHASTNATGSAFGVSATGPVAIPPTPFVPPTSSSRPVRKSLAEVPANPLVRASVLSAAAWAGHGRASVADLKLARAGLTADLITAKCENGNGVSHLTKVVLNGRTLAVRPRPNSAVVVQLDKIGTATVTLNKQVRNPDGGLTVTAVEVSLPLGAGQTETVSIASVTCGRATSGEPTPPDGRNPSASPAPTASTPGAAPGVAPAPTPVPGDLPVTG